LVELKNIIEAQNTKIDAQQALIEEQGAKLDNITAFLERMEPLLKRCAKKDSTIIDSLSAVKLSSENAVKGVAETLTAVNTISLLSSKKRGSILPLESKAGVAVFERNWANEINRKSWRKRLLRNCSECGCTRQEIGRVYFEPRCNYGIYVRGTVFPQKVLHIYNDV